MQTLFGGDQGNSWVILAIKVLFVPVETPTMLPS